MSKREWDQRTPTDGQSLPGVGGLTTERYLLPGLARVVPEPGFGFPAHRLMVGERSVAALGRYSFFNVFFGRGQRIELPDNTRWRLCAIGVASNICPLIVNSAGRRVSQASLRTGSYGINGKRYGYVLKPIDFPRLGRARRWSLLEHDEELARFTRRPREINAFEPLPVAAALLAFVLLDFGIPGEKGPRIPAFRWG